MTKLSKGTSSTNIHTKAMKEYKLQKEKKEVFSPNMPQTHLTAKHFCQKPKHFLASWMFKQSSFSIHYIKKKLFPSSNAQQKSVYIAYL